MSRQWAGQNFIDEGSLWNQNRTSSSEAKNLAADRESYTLRICGIWFIAVLQTWLNLLVVFSYRFWIKLSREKEKGPSYSSFLRESGAAHKATGRLIFQTIPNVCKGVKVEGNALTSVPSLAQQPRSLIKSLQGSSMKSPAQGWSSKNTDWSEQEYWQASHRQNLPVIRLPLTDWFCGEGIELFIIFGTLDGSKIFQDLLAHHFVLYINPPKTDPFACCYTNLSIYCTVLLWEANDRAKNVKWRSGARLANCMNHF